MKFKEKSGILLLSTVAFFAGVFLGVPIAIFLGWVIGHMVRFLSGDFLVRGLNLLLGTERFTPEQIPLVMGTLFGISVLFRTANNRGGKND